MTCRRDDRIRSRPIPAVALFALLLLCSIHPVAAFIQGEWRAYGGMALGCDGPIVDMVATPDGTIYLGGSFSVCGNVVARNVARLDPSTGEFGALAGAGGNGVDTNVYALAFHEGALYVTGAFGEAGGSTAMGHIARWDGQEWSSLGTGLSNSGSSAWGLALGSHAGHLVVAGRFSHAGGTLVNNIARWDGGAWHPFSMGASVGVNGSVSSIASDGGKLYAAGSFTAAGAVSAYRLAVWQEGAWQALSGGLTWGPPPPWIDTMEAYGGDLYVAGQFTAAGGVSTTGIARWDGAEWHALGSPSHVWGIRRMSASDDGLVVTGTFSLAGGVEANGLARWDGAQWHSMGSGLRPGGHRVGLALARVEDDLFVGGSFTYVDDAPAVNLAVLRNGEWQPNVAARAQGLHTEEPNDAAIRARALASFSGSLYAAGRFTLAGPSVVENIARWDGDQWQPLHGNSGVGLNGTVHDLLDFDGALWVAGKFTQAGGVDSPHIARWTGDAWQPFQPSLTLGGSGSSIGALATDGSELFVAGKFSSIDGVPANSVARWNGQTWIAMAEGLGPQGTASALEMHDGHLYLAGRISNDLAAPAVVMRWDGSQWAETEGQLGWLGPGNTVHASVDSLVSTEWGLVAIGLFDRAGQEVSRNVAVRRDGGEWGAVDTFDTGISGRATAVASYGNGVALAVRTLGDSYSSLSLLYRSLDRSCLSACWLAMGDGELQTSFVPHVREVSAMTEHDGRLFLSGGFSTLQTTSRVDAALAFAAFVPDRLFASSNEMP